MSTRVSLCSDFSDKIIAPCLDFKGRIIVRNILASFVNQAFNFSAQADYN
jgi:hypothetical protein